MESRENKDFDLYKDIQGRTGGEIYMKIQKNVRKMSFPSQLQEKQL